MSSNLINKLQVYFLKTWYKKYIVYIGVQYIRKSIGVAWNVGPYTVLNNFLWYILEKNEKNKTGRIVDHVFTKYFCSWGFSVNSK